MRYLRLLGTFIRAAIQNESAYRLNAVMRLLSTGLSLAGGIGGIAVLFQATDNLNGWSKAETLAVLGVYMLVLAVNGLVISPSLHKLGGMGGEIETGNFDYTLLKPLSKQYYISVREWSVWPLLDIAVSLGVIGFAVSQMEASLTAAVLGMFLVSLVIALGLLYSLMLLLSSVAFWYRGTYVLWIMGDVLQTGKYPVSIYPRPVKLVLTWVFPVGFIVSTPAEVLMQRAEPVTLAAGFLLMLVLFAAASLLFNRSLRKYAGASS
ncbi:ABC transporter permease [Paenibacillus tengchongensis]|uniref:ABC transporter permease n=1 Tax=Paenibacillus tengchongensis TaxID=2608684 RepID=UPI00124E628D|nr:ABC-2 family transporter protein [Paenibacillus tengchongensis]